ncbi:hypothetical protein Clacol_006587 [Clathrus columnatus]|uniref:chitinase n=1 Tax=Clathrus columnatus TaxID=1419009 RepID=A0AAV5ACG7_9AGAM|nr:hypothetical protein Clacol_006587 [Clathrus columnatus]
MAEAPETFSANTTQVMRRPANYKSQLHPNPPLVHNGSVAMRNTLQKRSAGYVSMGYFTNWGIYARNFQPTNIVSSTLTHILYAFADVDPNSGTISLTDTYADEQGNNLYGCLKQMYLLKMQKRTLKVLLSIGGWTYSQDGHFAFVTNASYRQTFVNDAVGMVEGINIFFKPSLAVLINYILDYGLDGIDLDFEYPSSSAQGTGFASLITELRTAFNQLAERKGDTVPYQITVAVSAGTANNEFLVVPTMDAAVSYWNLMAYDYAGSWSNVSDDQANLYGGQISNVSTDMAFKSYISRGATSSKITMGMPLYGRGFEQTAGIRQPYNGVGPGTWEAGVYDYKDLPFSGAQVIMETNNVASYSYDSSKEELISYDIPEVVQLKTKYILTNNMAGSMFWSLDSDKLANDSLVGTSASVLGTLDQTQNHLSYPDSIWTNIANNMGTLNSTSSSTSSSSSSMPSTSPPGGQPTSSSSSSTVPPSSPTAGNCADGDLWTAKWWTENDTRKKTDFHFNRI